MRRRRVVVSPTCRAANRRAVARPALPVPRRRKS
jgi:hypothetical protein